MSEEDFPEALRRLEETAAELEAKLNAGKERTLRPLREKREQLLREEALLVAQNATLLAQCEELERQALEAGASPRSELALRGLTWILLGGGFLSLGLSGRPVPGEVSFGFLAVALMVAFALPRLR